MLTPDVHQKASSALGRQGMFMRKLVFLTFLGCACLTVNVNVTAQRITANGYEIVSIVQLITTPERFHSKKVSITGFLTLDFEVSKLCLFVDAPSINECVWIDLVGEMPEIRTEQQLSTWRKRRLDLQEQYNGRAISVHGIFDMNKGGHLGIYPGTIANTVVVRIVK